MIYIFQGDSDGIANNATVQIKNLTTDMMGVRFV